MRRRKKHNAYGTSNELMVHYVGSIALTVIVSVMVTIGIISFIVELIN